MNIMDFFQMTNLAISLFIFFFSVKLILALKGRINRIRFLYSFEDNLQEKEKEEFYERRFGIVLTRKNKFTNPLSILIYSIHVSVVSCAIYYFEHSFFELVIFIGSISSVILLFLYTHYSIKLEEYFLSVIKEKNGY